MNRDSIKSKIMSALPKSIIEDELEQAKFVKFLSEQTISPLLRDIIITDAIASLTKYEGSYSPNLIPLLKEKAKISQALGQTDVFYSSISEVYFLCLMNYPKHSLEIIECYYYFSLFSFEIEELEECIAYSNELIKKIRQLKQHYDLETFSTENLKLCMMYVKTIEWRCRLTNFSEDTKGARKILEELERFKLDNKDLLETGKLHEVDSSVLNYLIPINAALCNIDYFLLIDDNATCLKKMKSLMSIVKEKFTDKSELMIELISSIGRIYFKTHRIDHFNKHNDKLFHLLDYVHKFDNVFYCHAILQHYKNLMPYRDKNNFQTLWRGIIYLLDYYNKMFELNLYSETIINPEDILKQMKKTLLLGDIYYYCALITYHNDKKLICSQYISYAYQIYEVHVGINGTKTTKAVNLISLLKKEEKLVDREE